MTPRMGLRRIGLNLLYLVPGRVGGSEVYANELVRSLHALAPDLELVVYCAPEARAARAAEPWARAASLRAAPTPSANKPARFLVEQSWLPARAARDRVQLLHSLGTTAPALGRVPSVVTVLDLIYHHVPSTFPLASRLGLELIVGLGARRAAAVIAISDAGRDDIAATLAIAPERIAVTPLGLGATDAPARTTAEILRARYRLREETAVILCVSAALPHKNLERLIASVARIAPAHDVTLVIVGHAGRDSERLAAHARSAGVGDRVRLTGWIERADLEGLYAMARVFAYPSLIEGFGLPLLEAMSRGVPVASSNASALVEVGGDAAEYFDPLDVAAMAGAIARLLVDEARRGALIAAGRDRAAEFTWERCARATLAVYERVTAALGADRR
jgi:glycosyltransferase involved in cell wall biosynthesis